MAGPVVLSWRHITLKIGEHTFVSLASDDQPVTFPNMDLVDVVYGKSGEMYGNETGMLGGDVSVRVLPASRDARQLLTWLAQRHKGSRRTFSGMFGDSRLGFSVQMKGGLMKSCTAASVPGADFEAVFSFQEIIPDYDGAEFNNDGPVQANDDASLGSGDSRAVHDSLFPDGGTAASDVFDESTGLDLDF